MKARLNKEKYSFGGASNVVGNLLALGVRVTFITPVADDKYKDLYTNWSHPLLILKPLWFKGQNVVKSRYWVSHNEGTYKYLQINQGTRFENLDMAISCLKKVLDTEDFDKAILIDYCGGVFEDRLAVEKFLSHLDTRNINTYSASQVSDEDNRYDIFQGSGLICMNLSEAKSVLPSFSLTDESINKLSSLLSSRVCVTLGAAGSVLSDGSGVDRHEGHIIRSVDACGAGDSFLAALVASGDDLEFSNKWAAAATLRLGTCVPNLEEVLSW